MDGDRIATEIVIHFRRPVAAETATSIADEASRTAASILGNQICQGELPLTKAELKSLLVVRTPSAVTKFADIDVKALALLDNDGPLQSTARGRRSSPVPSPKADAAPPPRPSRSVSGLQQALVPPKAPSTPPPVRVNGSDAPKSLWVEALEHYSGQHTNEELAAFLGDALRDSAASAVYLALLACDPRQVPRLPRENAESRQQSLLLEAGGFFGVALYRSLAARGVEKTQCTAITEGVLRHALDAELPGITARMNPYFASHAPIAELASRLTKLLASPGDRQSILEALTRYCQPLRNEFAAVAGHVRRLSA